MIYKYVWQTCQQSLKIISIEQSFVRGNYTFSELCSSRKYPYPHPTAPPPHHGGQKFQREGGPKRGNFRGVGGLLTIAYRGFFTRHPSPATRGKVLPIPRDMPHCTLNERDIMYEKAKYIINIHVKHTYDGFLISKKIYDFSRNCVDFQQ